MGRGPDTAEKKVCGVGKKNSSSGKEKILNLVLVRRPQLFEALIFNIAQSRAPFLTTDFGYLKFPPEKGR